MPCGKRSRYWALPSSLWLRPAGGAHSVVDYALGISAAVLRSASDARRAARARHSGADRTDAEPRGDGSVSLRAQSYLRCRRRRHSGPSDPVRRLASHDLRRAHVARLPRLCPDVRGAGACSEVWDPVRGFPGQRPAVDSAAHAQPHDAKSFVTRAPPREGRDSVLCRKMARHLGVRY